MSSLNVFGRNLRKNYPIAASGNGIYIYDKEGKDYLDGSSGALVVSLGHGNKEIIETVYEQMNEISFAHTSQFHTEILQKYAKKLSIIAPGQLNYAYLVAGGSEGVETALKLARQYYTEKGQPEKHKVIGRWPSFHGHSLGALSVGGYTNWRKPHHPNLIPFPHINAPINTLGSDEEIRDYAIQCAKELEETILREDPDSISAFIFEPIIGSSASAIVAPNEYFKIVEQVCNKYDILLIADEVMCGFGRAGEIFASNIFGMKPDIIVSGKGISSGYAPLGLVMAHEKIYTTIKNGSGRFIHGFTSSGNPVSSAAGLAVLNYIEKYEVLSNVKKMSLYLEQKLLKLYKQFNFVGNIRGIGLMWGIEFIANKEEEKRFPRSKNFTSLVVSECFRNGLIVYPSQMFRADGTGDSIMIAPPLIITEQEIDLLMKRLNKSLEVIESKVFSSSVER